jgi:hypothetical protein
MLHGVRILMCSGIQSTMRLQYSRISVSRRECLRGRVQNSPEEGMWYSVFLRSAKTELVPANRNITDQTFI